MRKVVVAALSVLAILCMVSCSTVSPVAGATGAVGEKTGEATQTFILGYPLDGEGGIMQAAKNGGITNVGTVDVRVDYPASPLIPYWVVTTVVSGE